MASSSDHQPPFSVALNFSVALIFSGDHFEQPPHHSSSCKTHPCVCVCVPSGETRQEPGPAASFHGDPSADRLLQLQTRSPPATAPITYLSGELRADHSSPDLFDQRTLIPLAAVNTQVLVCLAREATEGVRAYCHLSQLVVLTDKVARCLDELYYGDTHVVISKWKGCWGRPDTPKLNSTKVNPRSKLVNRQIQSTSGSTSYVRDAKTNTLV
ncbi:hypothetical protein R6Q59_023570 [Mikania micrantha]